MSYQKLAGQGLIIAAPCSSSGKTLVTLGLLRLFSRSGINIASAKAGPDYIDPQFHALASGKDCINLDPWAMRPQLLQALVKTAAGEMPILIEGMMGLFDGAADGTGSVADLASLFKLPVLLVVDAAKQSHSVAALVEGFSNHRANVEVTGVVLNRVGSARHEKMLRSALGNIPVIGVVRRMAELTMPERHLGLVLASERTDIGQFIDRAADIMEQSVDMDALLAMFSKVAQRQHRQFPARIQPPGQNVAIARDKAFAFIYPHLLEGWREQGASIEFFSPLADEKPVRNADSIYLPGGYPELHAARIASNAIFIDALVDHAAKGTIIYGECGGYMVLGEGLVDGNGLRHKMAGLLPLVTSFENPKLHLGYRTAKPLQDWPFAEGRSEFSAHEFHYASTISEESATPLFSVNDAFGDDLGTVGLVQKNISGSFMHLIDLK